MIDDVSVVGGGIGGLAVGSQLAAADLAVSIYEKNDQVGGRASVLEADGFRFDMGPSWYLMPDVYERHFTRFDADPRDYYDLVHLDPHYRVFFKDGDVVDMTGDLDALAAIFESYEPGAGDALRGYLARARETYEIGMEHFVYVDRPRFRDYLDRTVLREARGLGLLRSMESYVRDWFSHPKLRQLVQYSLVFLGGSPATTPAIYRLMSHVDVNLGVFYPMGGLGEVVDGLATVAQRQGVRIKTDTEISQIRGSRGKFDLKTADGRDVSSSIVVSNADFIHTEQALLEPDARQYDREYWSSRTIAPSAFLLYLGVEGSVEPLVHHSLVLPTDWSPHFASIFDDPSWPADPAYYVCSPSSTDPTVAPRGHTAMFILVPIAAGLASSDAAIERYRDVVLEDLARHTGVEIRDRIVFEERFCVRDFADRYNAYQGTALGLAHTLRQTGPMRPDHRSNSLDGLYFTGGYTRPGIGVPMCLISGKHAADAVLNDHRGPADR